MKTILLVFILFCFIPAQAKSGICVKAIDNENEAIAYSQEIVQSHHLTSIKNSCLTFQLFSYTKESGYLIQVREKHDEACGGDPQISPKLFSMLINKKGQVKTDIYDQTTFKTLKCRKTK